MSTPIEIFTVKIKMNQKIYEFLRTIPAGRVVTYGQIALYLGNKNMARAVGNALHKNPDPNAIPCHRVVNYKGEVSSAYAFGGRDAQRKRLEEEGIIFEKNGTIDLKKYGVGLIG